MEWHVDAALLESLPAIGIWGAVGLAVVAAAWFWVLALLDWRKRDFGVTEERDKWMIRLIYGGCIGAAVYWLWGRSKGKLAEDEGAEDATESKEAEAV